MQTLTTTHETTITEQDCYLLTDAGQDALRECEGLPLRDDPEDAAPEGFYPDTTEAEVDWVLRKINDARARAARIRENMEKMAGEADAEVGQLLQEALLQVEVGGAAGDRIARRARGGDEGEERRDHCGCPDDHPEGDRPGAYAVHVVLS